MDDKYWDDEYSDHQYWDMDWRNEGKRKIRCQLNELNCAIDREPENIKNYQSKAQILQNQLTYAQGLSRIKLLVQLFNCYCIEFVLVQENQILYSKSPEFDLQLEKGEKTIVVNQIQEIRNEVSNRIKELDFNINNKYEENLYYDKAQNYLILAFCEIENSQFKILFSKALQTFDEAINLNQVEQKKLLNRKFKFVEKSLQDFQFHHPNDFLEIILEGIKVYDQMIKVEPEGLVRINQLKINFLNNNLFSLSNQEQKLCKNDFEKIQEICQYAMNSAQGEIAAETEQEKQIGILLKKGQIFMIFYQLFSTRITHEVQRQKYYTQAFKCISEILNIIQQLKDQKLTEEILLYEIRTLHSITSFLRNEDYSKYYRLILNVYEKLIIINPKDINILNQYFDEINHLNSYQQYKDEDILNLKCKVLDKMIDAQPSENFILYKVITLVSIAELKSSFNEKQKGYELAFESYKNACIKFPDYNLTFKEKIQFLFEISEKLGIHKTMNKYYQQVFHELKTYPCSLQKVKYLSANLMAQIRFILGNFNDTDTKIMIKNLIDLCDFWLKQSKGHDVSKILKGYIMETIGNIVNESEKQQYYNEALVCYSVYQGNSYHKFNLLNQLNKRLEALAWCYNSVQNGDHSIVLYFLHNLSDFNLNRNWLQARRNYYIEPSSWRSRISDQI